MKSLKRMVVELYGRPAKHCNKSSPGDVTKSFLLFCVDSRRGTLETGSKLHSIQQPMRRKTHREDLDRLQCYDESEVVTYLRRGMLSRVLESTASAYLSNCSESNQKSKTWLTVQKTDL